MPAYQFVGKHPEHIVGLEAGDLSEQEYDALPWELQQAVLLNRGSDGGPLYSEVRESADAIVTEASPDDVSVVIPEPAPAEPDQPLEPPADLPTEGAN